MIHSLAFLHLIYFNGFLIKKEAKIVIYLVWFKAYTVAFYNNEREGSNNSLLKLQVFPTNNIYLFNYKPLCLTHAVVASLR